MKSEKYFPLMIVYSTGPTIAAQIVQNNKFKPFKCLIRLLTNKIKYYI